MVREEFDCVGDAFCSCLGDIDAMAPMVSSCLIKIPSFDAMYFPGASFG
jgi:hypothetical protein